MKKNKQKKILENLSEVEYSVFSQWGEDGVIDWLISQKNDVKDYFIELEQVTTKSLIQGIFYKIEIGQIIDRR